MQYERSYTNEKNIPLHIRNIMGIGSDWFFMHSMQYSSQMYDIRGNIFYSQIFFIQLHTGL